LEREKARIERRLQLVKEGSEQELNLKRLQLQTEADIALQNDDLLAEQRLAIRTRLNQDLIALDEERIRMELAKGLEALDIQEQRIKQAASIQRTEILQSEELTGEQRKSKLEELENTISESLFQIRETRLESQIAQSEANSLERARLETELTQLRENRITEIESAAIERRKELQESEQERRDELLDNFNTVIDATQSVTDALQRRAEQVIELHGEESRQARQARQVQKAAARVEVAANLAQQLSSIALTSQKIAAQFPPASVPIGVAYGVTSGAIAIASAKTRLEEISALSGGGPTSSQNNFANVQVTYKGKPVSLADAYAQRFGYVTKPTIAMTGEEGTEFVAAHKTTIHPKFAPMIREMDTYQKSGYVQNYASGGYTVETVLPAFQQGGFSSAVNQISISSDREQEQAEFRALLLDLSNRPIYTAIEDINRGQGRFAKVQQNARP
jgi:hypothetical protein